MSLKALNQRFARSRSFPVPSSLRRYKSSKSSNLSFFSLTPLPSSKRNRNERKIPTSSLTLRIMFFSRSSFGDYVIPVDDPQFAVAEGSRISCGGWKVQRRLFRSFIVTLSLFFAAERRKETKKRERRLKHGSDRRVRRVPTYTAGLAPACLPSILTKLQRLTTRGGARHYLSARKKLI